MINILILMGNLLLNDQSLPAGFIKIVIAIGT